MCVHNTTPPTPTLRLLQKQQQVYKAVSQKEERIPDHTKVGMGASWTQGVLYNSPLLSILVTAEGPPSFSEIPSSPTTHAGTDTTFLGTQLPRVE